MYSNDIVNFQESTRILNAGTKKKNVWKLIEYTTYIVFESTPSLMLASLLPSPFLDIYSLSTSSLGCNA